MGIKIRGLTKIFSGETKPSIDHLDAELPSGKIIGLVGPDGAGKTTLIRLLTGLLPPTSGECYVHDIPSFREQEHLYQIIGYMPQRFGLYEDLTVMQNLTLYCDLQGVSKNTAEIDHLLDFAGLSPFKERRAGDLSGGMKQKLGLICTMLKTPKALLLDEPSVGVDPFSRRELWRMIEDLKEKKVTILWSTSYLDEAENCDYVLLLNEGVSRFQGAPEKFTEKLENKTFQVKKIATEKRTVLDHAMKDARVIDAMIQGDAVRMVIKEEDNVPSVQDLDAGEGASIVQISPSFEDAFINLLGGSRPQKTVTIRKERDDSHEEAQVSVANLTKKFGNFTAVDNLSFEVQRGEIFGLLGPNGAGKSTTFKMLCGLLTPTNGEALVAGISMQKAKSSARSKLGYMAQKFSMYDNMTVYQNMRFFSGVYPVKSDERDQIIDKMISLFDLSSYVDHKAGGLPLGMKQRLALTCSLMHQPEVLFLDEPTSGVDPLTRREFWHHINSLAEQGVTVMVTTHFMEEAEYCDRIGLIHKGKLRALDTPDALKKMTQEQGGVDQPTLQDAFIFLCSGERNDSSH